MQILNISRNHWCVIFQISMHNFKLWLPKYQYNVLWGINPSILRQRLIETTCKTIRQSIVNYECNYIWLLQSFTSKVFSRSLMNCWAIELTVDKLCFQKKFSSSNFKVFEFLSFLIFKLNVRKRNFWKPSWFLIMINF